MTRPTFHHLLGWSLAAGFALLLVAALGVGAITYDRAYTDRMFPGVRIGPVDVGGLTRAAALAAVEARVDAYLAQGIPFLLDNRTAPVPAIIRAPQSDLTYALVAIDADALVAEAFAIGRRDAFAASWSERVRGAVGDERTVPIRGTVDRDRLITEIAEVFGNALMPMEPPRIRATSDGSGAAAWTVTDGVAGRMVDTAALERMLTVRIASLDTTTVALPVATVPPPYTRAMIEARLPEFDRALARAPIALTYDARRWTVTATILAGWFAVDATAAPALDAARIEEFLASIAPEIERAPEDARFTIDPATKRVREFRAPQDGIRMDRAALLLALHDAVFGTRTPVIPIPTVVTSPAVPLASTNDLGIRDLLGTGRTSFAGSPANRRHNIGVGTRLLNGLLIAPGEIFSTVGALSPFDGTNGYKPELVIKENKTTPEFGGGLCQVSTTLFRAVLAAGLPVVERTNHAYRVSYYEPPIGMDATIYGPKPDFTFTNDTDTHILIRARVEGNELIYELWGTKDGRIATTSEPEVFNFVQPPPLKTVETETLAPGEKKCTERAHTGADAQFTYTVTTAAGQKNERVFRSHYRPWQAVCLVGKAKADSTEPGASAAPPAPTTDATPVPATHDASPVPAAPPSPDQLTVGGTS